MVDTLLRPAVTLRLAVADTRLRVAEDIQLRVMAAVDTQLRAVVEATRPQAAAVGVAVDSIRRAATMDPITDVTDDKF